MKDNNENSTYWNELAKEVCRQACYSFGDIATNPTDAIDNFTLFKLIILDNQFDKTRDFNAAMLNFVDATGHTNSRLSNFIEDIRSFANSIFGDRDVYETFMRCEFSGIFESTEFNKLLKSVNMLPNIINSQIGNYTCKFIRSNITCMRIEFALRIIQTFVTARPDLYVSVKTDYLKSKIKSITPWYYIMFLVD